MLAMQKQIKKREIRFSVHIPANHKRPDLHYIKEQITFEDGTTKPNTYLVKNFKRPVWVTKEAFRNYKEKKEFEAIEKLYCKETTQSDLNKVVANLLGQPQLMNSPDKIKNSPYVYGYDITSTSLIKLKSLMKNDFIQSPYTVSAFDIETNPLTGEIILASIAFGKKVHTSILAKFIRRVKTLDYTFKKVIETYLPKYKDYEYTYTVCDDELSLLKDIFQVANSWAPDFLAIWNMDFDIPTILRRIKQNKGDPLMIICDQDVPYDYRICRYKEGIKKKVTASGVVKPINPSLQWHSLISTTKFYVIDAMCTYRQLRMAKQEEPSYKLDYILQKEIKSEKLKFKEADQYSGTNWHIFMQENYPVEYIAYNIYDCIGMLELDEKTKDLSSVLPSFAGITDFGRFNSNPKKIVDALFLFGLERGKVIGTVGKIVDNDEVTEYNENDEFDDDDDDDVDIVTKLRKYKTLDLKGWIQLLPQNLLMNDGLKCLEDFPNVVTNLRGLVVDLDSVSSYPSCTLVANVSKATCVNEIIKILGIDEKVFREENLSICLGESNLLEYFNVMFGLPSLEAIDDIVDKYF